MTTQTYICVWCGVTRTVKVGRSTGVCLDCRATEEAFGDNKKGRAV